MDRERLNVDLSAVDKDAYWPGTPSRRCRREIESVVRKFGIKRTRAGMDVISDGHFEIGVCGDNPGHFDVVKRQSGGGDEWDDAEKRDL